VNFARDVVDTLPPQGLGMVSIDRVGRREEWTYGRISETSARMAGALRAAGVREGDVVLMLIGSRPEWVLLMLACFRIGAIALPCNEQLRAKDLLTRIRATQPRLIVTDERNLGELDAAGPTCAVVAIPDPRLARAEPVPPVELSPRDPCLIVFTSGSTGLPKPVVHGHSYLFGQRLQARHWMSARPGELVWCTAASGWSKSARNAFVAPWLSGAAALLHDARFDPEQRLDVLATERVNVLCMSPTEYRAIARRAMLRALPDLRGMIAAGEALNPETLAVWRDAVGVDIRDGYGQTETGQITATRPDEPARPGSMGRPLPGIETSIQDGELVIDAATVPTFGLGYFGGEELNAGPWRTGDRVSMDDDGYLRFLGRKDDLIISSGYRIGPSEVESALSAHSAVAEAAVVAEPDEERGSVVRAIVVLENGYSPSDHLASELQEHVKAHTAPYKYPRIIDWAAELPRTASGKISRSALREEHPSASSPEVR
jgi:acyl-coenzyme A synthetase/AMP-(fatty) acid ligase